MPAEETLLDYSGLASRPRVIGDVRKRPLIARIIGLLGLVPRCRPCDLFQTVGEGSPSVQRLLLAIVIVPTFAVAALADFQESKEALELEYYAVAISDIVMYARNGDPRAKYYLAKLYRSGLIGVPRDLSKANILDKEAVDEFMRAACAEGLGLMKDKASLPDLQKALANEPVRWVREKIEAAIKVIQG